MTAVSAGHIILTPTLPLGLGKTAAYDVKCDVTTPPPPPLDMDLI